MKLSWNKKRFRFKNSGAPVKAVIDAFDLRNNSDFPEILTSTTALRFFKGETVQKENKEKIYYGVAEAIVGGNLFQIWTSLYKKHAEEAIRMLCVLIDSFCAQWDCVVADCNAFKINIHAMAPLPYSRLLVIDIALRSAASYELSETNPATEEHLWFSECNRGSFLKKLKNRVPEKLTNDAIVSSLSISKNTLDSWLNGKSRPSEKNIKMLAKFFAPRLQTDTTVLEAKFKQHYGLHALKKTFEKFVTGEDIEQLFAKWRELTTLFYNLLQPFLESNERLKGPVSNEDIVYELFGNGSLSNIAPFFVGEAWARETDRLWATELCFSTLPDWSSRLNEAIKCLEIPKHVLNMAKQNAQSDYLQLLKFAIEQGQINQSLSITPAIQEKHRDLEHVHILRGDNNFKAANRMKQAFDADNCGNLEQAITHAKRAVELTPDHATRRFFYAAWLGVSTQYLHGSERNKRIEKALFELELTKQFFTVEQEKGITTGVREDVLWTESSIILMNNRRYEESLKELKKAEKHLKKKTIRLLTHLAINHFYLLQSGRGLQYVEDALTIEKSPRKNTEKEELRPEDLLGFALLCFQAGKIQSGRKLLNRFENTGFSERLNQRTSKQNLESLSPQESVDFYMSCLPWFQ